MTSLHLSRPITYALYRRYDNPTPDVREDTWRDIVALLTRHELSSCTLAPGPDQCPAHDRAARRRSCPAKYRSSRSDGYSAWSPVIIDGPRRAENVRGVTAVVIDLDHLDDDQAQRALNALAGLERIAHSTHSHAPGSASLRVVLLPTRVIQPGELKTVLDAVVRRYQLPADPSCRDAARQYFLPRAPKDAPRVGEHHAGALLDVEELLRWSEANPPPPPLLTHHESTPIVESAGWDLSSEPIQDLIDSIERYFPDHRRHELAMALAGALRRAGATKEDARHIIYEGFKRGGSDDPKTRAATVDHTWALAPESAMTGFLRMAEILPEEDAKEIGDAICVVANTEFLRGLRSPPSALAEASPPPLPPEATDTTPLAVSPDGRYAYDEKRRICSVTITGKPKEQVRVLSPSGNFGAAVLEERFLDDGSGARPRLVYRIVVWREGGEVLGTIDVPESEFSLMKWPSAHFGSAAVVRAKKAAADELREGILALSRPKKVRVYTHTGWREVAGRWGFLHAAGTVGVDDVEVELPEGLRAYELPPVTIDVREAVQRSLALLDVAPRKVTIPLIATTFLAPLSSSLLPDYVLLLRARTGSRKSELAALAINHYGAGWQRKRLPLDFRATSAAIENRLHASKDVLSVVDDLIPASNRMEQRAVEGKAQQIIHAVGNRMPRSRMTSTLDARPDRPPRGLPIMTGEILPPGHSTIARCLVVDVEGVDDAKLTIAQEHRARLAYAGRAYIEWLQPQYARLVDELPKRYAQLCADLRRRGGAHARTPDQLAYVLLGIELLSDFAREVGALDDVGVEELKASARQVVDALAERQAEVVTENDPVERYLTALRAMLAVGAVRLAPLAKKKSQVPLVAVDNAPLIGWRDDTTAYLITDAAVGEVSRFFVARNDHFSSSKKSIHEGLAAKKLIAQHAPGRHEHQLRADGTKLWVCAIPLAALVETTDDQPQLTLVRGQE